MPGAEKIAHTQAEQRHGAATRRGTIMSGDRDSRDLISAEADDQFTRMLHVFLSHIRTLM
jgi:hypothetical protein